MIRSAPRILTIAILLGGFARPAIVLAAAPAPFTESVTPTGYRVRVPLGEPVVARGDLFGNDLAEIALPGADPDDAPGALPLPVRTLFLRVPWGVDATVSASPGPARSIGVLRPAPFAHLLTDRSPRPRMDAATVAAALAGPAYSGRGLSGAPPLLTVRDLSAGGSRLLVVSLRPVTWDPASGEARALGEIVLTVRWDRPVEPVAAGVPAGLVPGTAVGPDFAPRALGGRAGLAVPLRRTALGATAAGPARVDPTRPWIRLGVLRSGLYIVTPSDLAAAGVAVGGIDPASFRLFRATPGDIPENVDVDLGPDSLRECAIEVTGAIDGAFDPADRILFYGTGSTGFGYDLSLGGGTEYQEAQQSDLQTLWLTWGAGAWAGPPRRIATRSAAPVTSGATVFSTVTHRIHAETNRLPSFSLYRPPLRWERWFDRLISQGSRVPFIFQLPGAVPGGAGDLRVRMWGLGNSIGGIPDHIARIYWHRVLADTAGWDLSEPQDLTASGLTIATRDTLEVEVPFVRDPIFPDPPYLRSDNSYFAWYEVSYPRSLAALNDTLQFAAPDSFAGTLQYVISAVGDTTAAWLLDRTDPESPVRLTSGAWTGSAPNFTLTAEDNVGPGLRLRYSLVSVARAARPASISLYAPQASAHAIADLLDSGNGADYLIVAPPAFLAAAETLAVYRSQRLPGFSSPRVRIATTDRIFAQFGSGLPTPTAIRNMLVYASRYWATPMPTYVCLLGDATYDPKNYLGIGALDFVPTYSNYYDGSTRTQFTSDDFYSFLDGPSDVLADLVVGRLPAGSAPEALGLVTTKIRAYESNTEFDTWRARALLCADDSNQRAQPDPLRNTHVEQMERKDSFHIPYPVERNKVYLNDFAFADTTRQTKPAARDEFISQINRGAWFVDYIGHGNEVVLADEQVFRASDVPRLTNAARPAIFGYFSCTVGKFDEPAGEGLGELLLTIPSGGAVASIAASDETFGTQSTPFNDSFFDEIFPLGSRVDSLRTAGLAYARAKNDHASSSNMSVRKYGFLGDPALTPPLPRGRGVWEKGPLDSLLRGDPVLIRGHAVMPDSSADTLSTGTAELLIQGPPFVRTQVHTPSAERRNYLIPGPTIYRGQVTLDRGAFEARFVVPSDGRISGRGGRLQALLSAAGGRGVGLAVDSIRFALGASSRSDGTPPAIRLFYPVGSDSTLRPGERVTFEVEDSSGVDLTRLDNAHAIFVTIDDRGSPYDLTPQFVYDRGSYTRGRVDFALPALGDGPHVLEVHASDNFRNIAVARFVVDMVTTAGATTALVLDQVFNYPNPFAQETFLHARLNQPARLTIRILTVAGRRVWETQVDAKAGENYIPWEGVDSVGEKVAIGVYLIQVTAESPSGVRASAIGRALRTK